ncbi:hypothetical protein C1645_818402 [Glomus cerebriforme]|uniref:Uncharacterized protein n=1 Tax=Glomus cerebriforme TaxID=658196 RepID=A0A397TA32_9GLOM|nr:hypothetical protein C1645_818402 [Glomus cerebriforme]
MNELADSIPVNRDRISTNFRVNYDTSKDPKQVILSIKVKYDMSSALEAVSSGSLNETSISSATNDLNPFDKISVDSIVEDLDIMIRNKTVTVLANGEASQYLDSGYGFNKIRNNGPLDDKEKNMSTKGNNGQTPSRFLRCCFAANNSDEGEEKDSDHAFLVIIVLLAGIDLENLNFLGILCDLDIPKIVIQGVYFSETIVIGYTPIVLFAYTIMKIIFALIMKVYDTLKEEKPKPKSDRCGIISTFKAMKEPVDKFKGYMSSIFCS